MRLPAIALAALCAVSACGRKTETAAPAAPASAPGSAATARVAASAMPPLVPAQVPSAVITQPQLAVDGEKLAREGGGGAVAACATCHGPGGEGNAQANFPRLAGLGRLYLLRQMDSYADGSRKNAVMQPIAAAMSGEQRQASAAYYAGLGPGPDAAPTKASPPRDEPALVSIGDEKRQLQGCANCHGPQGIGDAARNPYLAGQHAGYLAATLGAWKSGERNNDASGQMPAIAKALTDEEVKRLSAYYAGLPPPAARNAHTAPSSLAQNRTTFESGPALAAAPAQGVGTEQGAPLTGGAQGQGDAGAATNPAQTPR